MNDGEAKGLRFEVPLYRVRRGMAVGFGARQAPATSIPSWRPTVLARALALGYRIRQAVDTQEVASFSAVARQMQVSPQRVSCLVQLTLLPRARQEEILGCLPRIETGDSIRK